MRFRLLPPVLALPLLAGAAGADVMILKDGRILDGLKMEQVGKDVKVHFKNGDLVVPERLIQSVVIEGGPSFVPRTPEEKKKVEKGLVPFGKKWVKPAVRARLVQKRLKEKE